MLIGRLQSHKLLPSMLSRKAGGIWKKKTLSAIMRLYRIIKNIFRLGKVFTRKNQGNKLQQIRFHIPYRPLQNDAELYSDI